MVKQLQLFPDWVPSQSCWISLPRQPQVWGSSYLAARQLIIDLANTLIDFEPVQLLCEPGQRTVAKRYFDSRIELIELPSDELWLSDTAPLFAASGGRIKALQFTMRRSTRSRLALDLVGLLGQRLKRFGMAMLQGDFSVDGDGSMLVCRASLLNQARHQLDKDRIEELLARRFAIRRLLWLPGPLARNNKLINLARFIAPAEILLAGHTNSRDPNMPVALNAYDALNKKNLRSPSGETYRVFQVFNPPPLRLHGHLLCNSYVNYYLGNGVVCIPAFYKPRYDKAALELFKTLFPNHQVRQFQVLPLIAMGGGLHCVTRNYPLASRELSKLLDRLDWLEHIEQAASINPNQPGKKQTQKKARGG